MIVGEFLYRRKKLYLKRDEYVLGKRVAITVHDRHGNHEATLSCNIREVELPDENCFIVKVWSENEKLAEAIKKADIFEDTGLTIETGHVIAPIWRVRQSGKGN